MNDFLAKLYTLAAQRAQSIFVVFEQPQAGAYYLACRTIAAICNLVGYETFKVLAETDTGYFLP